MATFITVIGGYQNIRKPHGERFTLSEIEDMIGLTSELTGNNIDKVETAPLMGGAKVYFRQKGDVFCEYNRQANMHMHLALKPTTIYGDALFLTPEEQPENED